MVVEMRIPYFFLFRHHFLDLFQDHHLIVWNFLFKKNITNFLDEKYHAKKIQHINRNIKYFVRAYIHITKLSSILSCGSSVSTFSYLGIGALKNHFKNGKRLILDTKEVPCCIQLFEKKK